MTTINWNPSPREMRLWAVILGPALGGVGALFYFVEWGIFRGGENLAMVFWGFAVVAFATGITGTKAGLPAYWLWMGLVHVVTWTIGHVSLTLVFYLVVTPMALFARLLGRDRLGLRESGAASDWHSMEPALRHDPDRPF